MFWKVYQKDKINTCRMFETPENYGCSKRVKINFSPKRLYHSQNFSYKTLKPPLLKSKCVCLTYPISCESQMIKGAFLSFSLIT